LKTLARRRGTLILIALKRYKKESGRWPQTLADIQDGERAEIFIDPVNAGSFVYKLTDASFALYSKGENNIDENGKDGADDWPIWPVRGRKRRHDKAEFQ
jgi:hypothetical protein